MPSDREPIATRTFNNADGEVELKVYSPKQDPDGDYRCEFFIQWANGKTKRMSILGVDSMQSLLLAISAARVNLQIPGEVGVFDKTIEFCGMKNLGLEILGGRLNTFWSKLSDAI